MHGNAVDGAANGRHADRPCQFWCRRRGQVEDVNRAISAVDNEQALAPRIVGGDFCRAEHNAIVRTDLFQRQRNGRRWWRWGNVVVIAATSGKRARCKDKGEQMVRAASEHVYLSFLKSISIVSNHDERMTGASIMLRRPSAHLGV